MSAISKSALLPLLAAGLLLGAPAVQAAPDQPPAPKAVKQDAKKVRKDADRQQKAVKKDVKKDAKVRKDNVQKPKAKDSVRKSKDARKSLENRARESKDSRRKMDELLMQESFGDMNSSI